MVTLSKMKHPAWRLFTLIGYVVYCCAGAIMDRPALALVQQRIVVDDSSAYTLVYSPERDGCDDPAQNLTGAASDGSNGLIDAFVDRDGNVNLVISDTFISVRSSGPSILSTFAPGGGFVHNCSQNISTADPCAGGKDEGCSVREFRGQHYPWATYADEDSDRVVMYIRNNDGISDPCCRIAKNWTHDPPGCAVPPPPIGPGAAGVSRLFHTPCPHVNGSAGVTGSGLTEHDCCKYRAILVQHSEDGGRTWTMPPAPDRVAFASPFPFVYPVVSDVGDMSGIVRHPSDGFFYCLRVNGFLQNGYDDLRNRYKGVVACRSADPFNASQWRCWDGANFTMQYRDPYVYPVEKPEDNFPPPLKLAFDVNWMGNVVWSDKLQVFVFVCSMKRFKPGGTGDQVTGIAYLTSVDFVTWSEPQLLLPWDSKNTSAGSVAGSSDAPRAAIFEANANVAGRNFDRIGDNAHLFYQCWTGHETKGVSHGNICRVPLRVQ